MNPNHLNLIDIPDPDELFLDAKYTHNVKFNEYYNWIERYLVSAIYQAMMIDENEIFNAVV